MLLDVFQGKRGVSILDMQDKKCLTLREQSSRAVPRLLLAWFCFSPKLALPFIKRLRHADCRGTVAPQQTELTRQASDCVRHMAGLGRP